MLRLLNSPHSSSAAAGLSACAALAAPEGGVAPRIDRQPLQGARPLGADRIASHETPRVSSPALAFKGLMRNNRFSRMSGARANWNGMGLRAQLAPCLGES